MARCRVLATQPRKCAVSPGLGTTGSLRGCRGWQDFRDYPVLAEGDAVEEAQGRDGDADRVGRELPDSRQEQPAVSDLLGPSHSGDWSKWRANRATWPM